MLQGVNAFQSVSGEFKGVLGGFKGSWKSFTGISGSFRCISRHYKAKQSVLRYLKRFQRYLRGLHMLSDKLHGEFKEGFRGVTISYNAYNKLQERIRRFRTDLHGFRGFQRFFNAFMDVLGGFRRILAIFTGS